MALSAALSQLPSPVEARAHPLGRISFAFGNRFFIGLVLGFAWLGPAWWLRNFVVAMFFWDALLLAAWFWDLARLPPPEQIVVRRQWRTRPALSVASSIDLCISNGSGAFLNLLVLDEVPSSLVAEPAALTATLAGRATANLSYSILPRQRGDTRLGRVFLRYQSALHLAERRGSRRFA
jgi:uncharacterized protein (DUF58 family)